MEQLIDFPKRGDNILDLVLSTMPGQIHDIHSPDQLSDHEVVACSLSVYIKSTQTPRRKYFLYNKCCLRASVDTEMCCPKGKCGCQYFSVFCKGHTL